MSHNSRIRRVLITGLCLIAASLACWTGSAHAQTKPQWRFSVLGAVSECLLEQIGTLEDFEAGLREQLDSVNAMYNEPGVFDGTFEFYLDSLCVFDHSWTIQAHTPHPDQDYQIVYECGDFIAANWLHLPYNTVAVRTKRTAEVPFPFTSWGNRIIAHELGHGRGAIDLYALNVNAENNPISNDSFKFPSCMMSTGTCRDWHPHSVHIINTHGSKVLDTADYFMILHFPETVTIRVTDSTGVPIPHARLRLYGHSWYDLSVDPEPLGTGVTDSTGGWSWPRNYFDWYDPNAFYINAYRIWWVNLLVEVEFEGNYAYDWLPLTEPQVSFFENPGLPYVKTIAMRIDVSNPGGNTGVPEAYVLHQNYPNPFNSGTSICLTQTIPAQVHLEIVNALGQVETVLHDAPLGEGTHCFIWNGSGAASGVYFCRVVFGETKRSTKMVLLK